jgi:hypothetical protein
MPFVRSLGSSKSPNNANAPDQDLFPEFRYTSHVAIEELSLRTDPANVVKGAAVADVADSLAGSFGIHDGVVIEVNRAPIKTTRDLEQASAQRGRSWDLTLSRGGRLIRSRIGGRGARP